MQTIHSLAAAAGPERSSSPAGQGAPEPASAPVRWAWLSIPLFIVVIAWLFASGVGVDPRYESTPVFLLLTLVCGLLVSALMAVLLGRSFLIHRAPELLFIALGAIFWGAAGFAGAAAGALADADGYANVVATVYNVAAWLAALCHLVGATLPLSWRRPLASPVPWLVAAYTLAVGGMVALVGLTLAGRLPVFFVPGQGGTLVRELVLYSAMAMLVVTGLLFTKEPPQAGNAFKYLYGHALLLLAVGIFALLLGGPGTLLAWAGRSAHALGSIYMLVGVAQAGRLQRAQGLLADRPSDQGRLGYAVAVAMVVAAAALRLLLFPGLGNSFVFSTFYPALAFAALYAGLRAGILTSALAALLSTYFWFEPVGQFALKSPSDIEGIVVFFVTGVAISWMADRMRVAETRARQAEAGVAAQRDRLDDLVRERTAELEREIREHQRAEAEIQRLNAELEERVRQRTVELEHSNAALVRSNMELQRFAHAAAHDLQTPLRSIVGFSQLLRQEVAGCVDEREKEWLGLIIDNTRRLQTLIHELLSYSRLDAEARPFEPVDLEEVFGQVVAILASLVDEAGAEISRGPLPAVAGDRTQLAQLFQNLIENGIKYNRSAPPRVNIGCERGEGEWIVSVADNGIGIDPRHHSRIFEIFRRLHSHQDIPGTGIGLAVCHRVVERHGGRLWVESEPGRGSIFRFTLPASPV